MTATRAGRSPLVDPDLPLDRDDLVRGAERDGIPAITDPAFGTDWRDTDWRLADDAHVVAVTAEATLVAYDRRVDGETLTFSWADGHLEAGGSRWDPVSGRAVSGPHEGTALRRANDRTQTFLFAWKEFYPETDVFGL